MNERLINGHIQQHQWRIKNANNEKELDETLHWINDDLMNKLKCYPIEVSVLFRMILNRALNDMAVERMTDINVRRIQRMIAINQTANDGIYRGNEYVKKIKVNEANVNLLVPNSHDTDFYEPQTIMKGDKKKRNRKKKMIKIKE